MLSEIDFIIHHDKVYKVQTTFKNYMVQIGGVTGNVHNMNTYSYIKHESVVFSLSLL